MICTAKDTRNKGMDDQNTNNTEGGKDNLLRIGDVLEILPMSRTSFYRDIRDGIFPKPIKIGRRSYWSENEIRAKVDEVKTGATLGATQ